MRLMYYSGLLLLIGVAAAQPPLELKGLHAGGRRSSPNLGHPFKRHDPLKRHLIVQFKQPAQPQDLKTLRDRGAAVLEYIPQYAYVVSAPDRMSLDGLNLQWTGILSPEEKISPRLASDSIADEPYYSVVEFYPDVDMNDARALVLDSGLRLQDNPDLLAQNLLAFGTAESFQALAQWDEVAYIFPASQDLVQGTHVNACSGAMSAEGQIGQSVAKVGGWVPPGNSVALQYAFVNATEKLDAGAAQAEIVRAFNAWSKYVQVSWTATGDANANRTVAVMFASGDHGDGYPFNGPGVLAHTFYPYPINPEPIAGNMHFNDDENWHIGAQTDLFSVALHEAGHSLGLGHSDQPGSVMYPYYHKASELTQEDIGAIQQLYAAQNGDAPATPVTPAVPALTLTVTSPGITTAAPSLDLSGTVSGGTGAVQVAWSTNHGYSGIATGSTGWTIIGIPLGVGSNAIQLTATDSQNEQAIQTFTITYQPKTALTITSPAPGGTYTATSPSVTLTGSASDSTGITRIGWTTSTGSSGTANGTTQWTAGPIALASGATLITVTAYGQSSQTSSSSLQVLYLPPASPSDPNPPPTTPTTPGAAPALTIVNPASTTISTPDDSMPFSGTASSSITSVTWTTSNGDSGTANGTTNWTIPQVPLLVGSTTVIVRAYDASGKSAWRSVVVNRE